MAAHTWKKDRASTRIATRLKEVETVEIKEYVRDTNLAALPRNRAYRVDGVHIYVDILNLEAILRTTGVEGVICHKRALRFLNLHFRAVHRILQDVGAIEVDFHNQRLHAVITKPYGDEAGRVHRAVAMTQLIVDVLQQTGEEGDEITPAAEVRAGIDTGVALAVRNGRRGHSEPLFLGEPANHAAKRAGGGTKTGIFLTNKARAAIDLATVTSEDANALSASEVAVSRAGAALSITVDQVMREWRADLAVNPIGKFVFSGHTPPFSNLDLELLSPANSRRQWASSIYVDIDGFTSYVAANVCDDAQAKDVVRVLHVLRSEMDAVLTSDFGGRKVRFIGDCVHGVLAEGTAQTTDLEATVSTAALCAAAQRSSFDLALQTLEEEGIDVAGLGLAVGFELGALSLTRLGVKGSMVRCAVGIGVIVSEEEQFRCRGDETAMGVTAHANASAGVKALFGDSRKRAGLDFDTAVDELAGRLDETAVASKALAKALAAGSTGLLGATQPAAGSYTFPARSAAPTKPAGFA